MQKAPKPLRFKARPVPKDLFNKKLVENWIAAAKP